MVTKSKKPEVIMRGEEPYNGHVLVKEEGSLLIYRECEQKFGAHSYKMIDNPINQGILSLRLHRLNSNCRPARIIREQLKEVKPKNDPVFLHPIFDKLKRKV